MDEEANKDSVFVAIVAQGLGFYRDFDLSVLAPKQASNGLFERAEHLALHGQGSDAPCFRRCVGDLRVAVFQFQGGVKIEGQGIEDCIAERDDVGVQGQSGEGRLIDRGVVVGFSSVECV